MDNLLGLSKIQHCYTFLADLENAFYIAMAELILGIIVLAGNNKSFNQLFYIIVAAGILSIVYSTARRLEINRYLKKRRKLLSAWALSHKAEFYQSLVQYLAATKDNNTVQTTLAHLSKKPDFRNFVIGPAWTYFDFSYSTVRETKDGEFKSGDVYYGVMKAKLPRVLPNVFFDSKTARKRQFRFVFSKRQIYHFEGDFNKYFVTYIPANYSIDSLSFVTPDVMQALIDASQYDAEIVSDELFLYGPIYDHAQQIKDMSAKILAIRDSLKVTTSAYHDDHLTADAGWHDISAQGSRLARSRFMIYVNAAVFILYLAFYLFSIWK